MRLKIKKGIPLIDQHDKNFMYGGKFGGNFVAEGTLKPIQDLDKLFRKLRKNKKTFFVFDASTEGFSTIHQEPYYDMLYHNAKIYGVDPERIFFFYS